MALYIISTRWLVLASLTVFALAALVFNERYARLKDRLAAEHQLQLFQVGRPPCSPFHSARECPDRCHWDGTECRLCEVWGVGFSSTTDQYGSFCLDEALRQAQQINESASINAQIGSLRGQVGKLQHEMTATMTELNETRAQVGLPQFAGDVAVFSHFESANDDAIGQGWSDTGITHLPNYGYIHGRCDKCSGFELGGEYTLSRTFHMGIAHQRVRLAFRMWFVDSWDGGDGVTVHINDDQLYRTGDASQFCEGSCSGAWSSAPSPPNCRGQVQSQCFQDMEFDLNTTASELNVRFARFGDGEECDNESWGISEFHITAFLVV